MNQSIQEGASDSVQSNEGYYRVGSSVEISADKDGAVLPEVYQPCVGTWDEFKGDVRKFFGRIRAEQVERFEDIRDASRRLFRRGDRQEINGH